MSFWSDGQQTVGQLFRPALSRKDAQGGPVDESDLIVWILDDFMQIRMVVAQGQRRDLTEDVQQGIAVDVDNVIA